MKMCTKCQVEKSLDKFYKYKNKEKYHSWCKKCQTDNKKEHYSNNKDLYHKNIYRNTKWFLEFKLSLKCEKCGFNHPAALDFHHLDPKTKKINISMGRKTNPEMIELIMDEIKKCRVLCSNCHRIEHAIHYNRIIEEIKNRN